MNQVTDFRDTFYEHHVINESAFCFPYISNDMAAVPTTKREATPALFNIGPWIITW
jgi:hypothetical protein